MRDTSLFNRTAKPEELLKRIKGGISWFYWFIGLSILQTALQTGLPFFGIEMPFSLGLGLTFVLIPSVYELTNSLALTLILNALPIAILAIVAHLARKSLAAYAFGIALMIADLGVYIAIPDWIGIGIHTLALLFFVRGFLALREVKGTLRPNTLSQRARVSIAIAVGEGITERPLRNEGAERS